LRSHNSCTKPAHVKLRLYNSTLQCHLQTSLLYTTVTKWPTVTVHTFQIFLKCILFLHLSLWF
jgi:hypothetical protein